MSKKNTAVFLGLCVVVSMATILLWIYAPHIPFILGCACIVGFCLAWLLGGWNGGAPTTPPPQRFPRGNDYN